MKNTTAKLFLVILIVLGSSGCSYQESLAPNESDPYEEVNRSLYSFNENLDKAILEPVADSYDFILPKTIQTGVQNFLITLTTLSPLQINFFKGNYQNH